MVIRKKDVEFGALADLEERLIKEGYTYNLDKSKYSEYNIKYDKEGKVRSSARPMRTKRTVEVFEKPNGDIAELRWISHHPDTKTFYSHGKRFRNVAGADKWSLIYKPTIL